MIRGVVAVLGGLATFSAALFAMEAVGNAIVGADPEWIHRSVATQLFWLAWTVVSMAGGGWVTAWIAPRAKMAHAIVMGSIQAVFTLVALFTVTDSATPFWLWIGGIVTTPDSGTPPVGAGGSSVRR